MINISRIGDHLRVESVINFRRTSDQIREESVSSYPENTQLIDFGRYRSHKNCRTVVCFVYDPDHYIRNPDSLTTDLEKESRDELEVRVFIEPKR